MYKMGRMIKNVLAWFLCTIVVVGICMNISSNGPLAVIALAVMIVIPVVLRFTKKDARDKNKKAFAKEIAEQVKAVPGFGIEKNIAVVFDLQYMPEVKAIHLQGKELYREEENLQKIHHDVLYCRKLDGTYQIDTKSGKNNEENLAKYKKLLKYCAAELGPEYVGFLHYSYPVSSGYAGSVETYNISYAGGGMEQVTVSTGGGGAFFARGIVCHKEYYKAYKPHICATRDSFAYTKKRDRYFKKEADSKKLW